MKKDSQFYYEKFDKGENLWTKDILAEKAKVISLKTKFSVFTFNKTWEKYPIKTLSKNKTLKLLKEADISISTHNTISKFSNNEINDFINKWNNEEVDKVIYQLRRRFWHELDDNNKAVKRHEFRTLKILQQTELLRLVGNKSGIGDETKQHRVTKNSSNNSLRNSSSTGWQKVPGHYELLKSEMFLKKEDCIINLGDK